MITLEQFERFLTENGSSLQIFIREAQAQCGRVQLHESIALTLRNAFIWEHSSQGYDYWSVLHDKACRFEEQLTKMENDTMNQKFNEIAGLTDEQIESIITGELDVGIRVGFELEFQEIDGMAKDDLDNTDDCDCDPEYDTDAMTSDARNAIHDNWSDYVEDFFSNALARLRAIDKPLTDAMSKLHEDLHCSFHAECDSFSDLRDHLIWLYDHEYLTYVTSRDFTSDRIKGILRDVLNEEVDNYIEGLDPSDYILDRSEWCNCPTGFDALREKVCLPDNTELKSDGSVSGGEITSIGANSVKTAIDLTTSVLTHNELTIDTGCSYHIHVSVQGVKHSYGKDFQLECMKSLLNDIPLFPERLKQRLTKTRGYYHFKNNNDKYTAVSFNSGYGTWEFRVMGNIDSTPDATTCYRLVLRALRHAYRVKVGLVEAAEYQDIGEEIVQEGITALRTYDEIVSDILTPNPAAVNS